MPRKARIAMPAAFLLAVLASAQQVQVREEMLANGMKLLLVERHDSPTVSCGWVARVGSVNEAPGITGISHLFEHMMFKGTKAIGTTDFARDAEILKQQDAIRSQMEKEYTLLREKARRGEVMGSIYDPANMTPALKELKGQLEKLYAAEKEVVVSEELEKIYTREGASGSNAGTTEDQTLYFVTLPANKLQLWFWMESDRLLNPVFREFYAERDDSTALEAARVGEQGAVTAGDRVAEWVVGQTLEQARRQELAPALHHGLHASQCQPHRADERARARSGNARDRHLGSLEHVEDAKMREAAGAAAAEDEHDAAATRQPRDQIVNQPHPGPALIPARS